MDENFGNIIKRVRQVVCLFKHSPTKNDKVLQIYVKAEHGTELSLILDCKTRWSSLFTMLERFLKLQCPIRKALIDLKSTIVFSELDFTQVENLVRALETVKLTVDALCRRDSNLLTAEIALKFMITKLHSLDSPVSRELAAALSTRIRQRRTQLSGVLWYLHNPFAQMTSEDEVDDLFAMPTIGQIRQIIKLLAERLDNSVQVLQQEPEPSTTISAGTTTVGENSKHSLKDELQLAISNAIQIPAQQSTVGLGKEDSLSTIIWQETSRFEGGGGRGRILQRAYQYLMSVPPTSVESERAFSSAAIVCSKLRTRLGDETIDNLCMLRTFFQV